jgi:predicted DNA-binding transcriptional regulator AlpA
MKTNFGEGGYRYADLKERRIVSSRSDLHDKQRKLAFPKPVKLGDGPRAGALFLKSEVEHWLAGRAALRDNSAK